MTSTSNRRRGVASSSRGTAHASSPTAHTDAYSVTRASRTEADFASVKLARPFAAWLKRESARRGTFMYELAEELVARGYGGRRPWRDR
jgi:acyl-CoA reductase-like NAD-dependent aldehyde dehydrogenase